MGQRSTPESLRRDSLNILERAWAQSAGFCYPNRKTYPHLWLWDSCFHSIAWSAFADPRAVTELRAVFAGQFGNGFLPHMRFMKPTTSRGPLTTVSSFTQPPVYARALKAASDAGLVVPSSLLDAALLALARLWADRLRDDLLVVVHPWETGADDSPRWDSWVGRTNWSRRRWTRFDRDVLHATEYATDGRALRNRLFEVAPAAFNAIAADAAVTIGGLAGRPDWTARGRALAQALDARAWSDESRLWSDIAIVGGGTSIAVPTLDGAMPILSTVDSMKAADATRQLLAPERFAAPFGLRYVTRDETSYNARQYWRGPCWPQINYLLTIAVREAGHHDAADVIAAATARGCAKARFSEYWNPETGRGFGARPQTWSAVVSAVV